MKNLKIGILREGKVPPDKRVPFTPQQCILVQNQYPNVEIIIQPSPIRCFADQEYIDLGLKVQENLAECDIIMGVKEVNVSDLIPGKKFMFFSHTVKKQAHNRKLLQSILLNKIELIDYEILLNNERKRIIGFGRFAGIVGAYNGLLAYGLKTKSFELKRAKDCNSREELEKELKGIIFPSDFRLVLTGFGKVGYGAREILDLLDVKEVTPEEFMNVKFNEPIFTQLETADYFERNSDSQFDKQDFYKYPEKYRSCLNKYVETADMYISCHFWSKNSPVLLTKEHLKKSNRLKVVADISCDVNGPIACTHKASTILDPIFGYNKMTGVEDAWELEDSIAIMSIDNLPCELPKEASEDFGKQLINNVFPYLLGPDVDGIIEGAMETDKNGKLTEKYSFLQDYVDDDTN